MKQLNPEQKQKVTNIIADYAECDPRAIEDGDNFKSDLGVDSIEIIEIVLDIEKEFNICIPDDEVDGVEIVEELYATVALFI